MGAGEIAEGGDAEGGKAALDEVAAGGRIEPVPDGGVRPGRGETVRVDDGPADEARGLAFQGLVCNRRALAAGILRAETELGVPEVAASPDPYRRAFAPGSARSGGAHGVAGALEAGERLLLGAGIGVVAVLGRRRTRRRFP